MNRVFVPRDSAALAMGADEVAAAIAAEAARRGLTLELIRNGTRGLLWLEPLVEVETPAGRVGYGNVAVEQVAGLFDAGAFASGSGTGGAHPAHLGLVEQIPYLKNQQRLTFARLGITDPLSTEDYLAHGGLQGLRQALAMSGQDACQTLIDSGLRGRGGAAFPAGIKWRTVLGAAAPQKYVVCNADEGDSGTFSDRLAMENDPFMLLEGMTIAGISTGATEGWIYVRSEYPHAVAVLEQALALARAAGWLGQNILGSGRVFELYVVMGAGSYVCGEETALLESLEGKKGQPRFKPPFPASFGVYGKPTTINNTETFAAVPFLLTIGPQQYLELGKPNNGGTKIFSVSGDVELPGNYEVPLGTPFAKLLELAGGMRGGKKIKAVIPGGSSAPVVPGQMMMETDMDYDAIAKAGSMLGSGAVIVMDETRCMVRSLMRLSYFYFEESCGQCTPCREGTGWLYRVVHRIENGLGRPEDLDLLNSVSENIMGRTICALGDAAAMPVRGMLKHFWDEFEYHVEHKHCLVSSNAHA